jgi:hypothetical protein
MGKKLLTWAVIGFLLFFVAAQPDAAARVARSIGASLMYLARGFSDLFSRIF